MMQARFYVACFFYIQSGLACKMFCLNSDHKQTSTPPKTNMDTQNDGLDGTVYFTGVEQCEDNLCSIRGGVLIWLI